MRRPRSWTARHWLILLLAGIAALSVVLHVTGHPPKNCTWVRYGLGGKGAYYERCVPNPGRPGTHSVNAGFHGWNYEFAVLGVLFVAMIGLTVFVRVLDKRSREADRHRQGDWT